MKFVLVFVLGWWASERFYRQADRLIEYLESEETKQKASDWVARKLEDLEKR